MNDETGGEGAEYENGTTVESEVTRRWILCAAAAACSLCLAGCARRPVERVEWTTMGTVAAVQTRGGGVAAMRKVVQEAFEDVRREFDAHDPQSAINRLGGCTDFGRPCHECALRLREESGGVFNHEWRGKGKLDYGAIAKGFAVDVAAERLKAAGLQDADALIDLGGNLKAVKGDWRVGIKDPFGSGVCREILLKEGESLATSATYFRGAHIRDGRTGEAAEGSGVASVTVRCESAMLADGLSTTLFILGPAKGLDFLSRHGGGARAFFVMSDGSIVEN